MTTPVGVDSILSQIKQMRQQSAMPTPAPIQPPSTPAVGVTQGVEGAGKVSFGGMFQQSVQAVNQMQQAGAAKASAFEAGENISLTEVMVSLQKADVSFKAMVEVRNKMIDAYQEIMRMSV